MTMPMPEISIIISAFNSKSWEKILSIATTTSRVVTNQIPKIEARAPITSEKKFITKKRRKIRIILLNAVSSWDCLLTDRYGIRAVKSPSNAGIDMGVRVVLSLDWCQSQLATYQSVCTQRTYARLAGDPLSIWRLDR